MNILGRSVRNLVRLAGYSLVRCQKSTGYPMDFTAKEAALVDAVMPYTMTPPGRVLAMIHAVDYIQRCAIEGDIVECGVWRGGSMMAAAKTLIANDATDRTLWLYDTFEGMTAPTVHDVSSKGIKASDKFAKRQSSDDRSNWCNASIEDVTQNMKSTGYPQERIRLVKGKVEETISAQAPSKIAILRLDTDWYESTRHEMEMLFPRLVQGGILIIDDYGDWAGARKAVDEYLAAHRVPLFLGRIDDTARLGIKIS